MRRYDESDARVRPNPRGSRPRSKIRPTHDSAADGFVIAVDRGRFTVRVGDAVVSAVKARELGRRGLVVGDRVGVVGDVSGAPDTLARVVRRDEREHALRRSADDADAAERVLVANAAQLVIVTALADPEPNTRMIDRCLVAAFDAGMRAVMVLTKADLAPADAVREAYLPLGVTVLTTRTDAAGIAGLDAVERELRGVMSVLVGYSGVGKSTLVNALVPTALRSTGVVNVVTGRGRHTSTSARALELPQGGWIIDTPGVRTFGLAHVDPDHFIAAFPDVADAALDLCPRGCAHTSAADGCALDAWASTPDQHTRLDSIRRLLASRAAADAEDPTRTTPRARPEAADPTRPAPRAE